MIEAWFDPALAWISGMPVGAIGGGLGDPLAGYFAPRGKFKKLVLGFYYIIVAISAILFYCL